MMKKCQKCQKQKDLTEYGLDKSRKDKHNRYCKICWRDISKNNRNPEKQKEWYQKNKQSVLQKCKEYRKRKPEDPILKKYKAINRLYNISIEDYKTMYNLQEGKCAICNGSISIEYGADNPAVVDHNHKTGVVRKLLCKKCNQAIGLLNDNPELCFKAYEYLK